MENKTSSGPECLGDVPADDHSTVREDADPLVCVGLLHLPFRVLPAPHLGQRSLDHRPLPFHGRAELAKHEDRLARLPHAIEVERRLVHHICLRSIHDEAGVCGHPKQTACQPRGIDRRACARLRAHPQGAPVSDRAN